MKKITEKEGDELILFMNIKQIGKRKNVVDKVPFTYEKVPKTVREFIEETVRICVDAYKEATNWSQYADIIYPLSEYE